MDPQNSCMIGGTVWVAKCSRQSYRTAQESWLTLLKQHVQYLFINLWNLREHVFFVIKHPGEVVLASWKKLTQHTRVVERHNNSIAQVLRQTHELLCDGGGSRVMVENTNQVVDVMCLRMM